MKINGKGIGPSPVYLTGALFPMSPLRFEQKTLRGESMMDTLEWKF